MIVLRTIAKMLPKILPKTGAKKIPVVGLVVGIGLGIWRLTDGDYAKAVA